MGYATLSISRILSPMSLIMGFGLAALCACSQAHADVSGVYIDSSPTFVEMVQIVKTPDGRIAGRIETTTIDEQGKLETLDFAIQGAADGNQIALSAKSILFNGEISLSGFVDGDLLDLSAPGGHRTYQRADTYAYQAAVTGLQARAGQIQTALSTDKARQNHSELTEILNKLRAREPNIRRQLDEAAEHYTKLFDRLHNQQRAASTYWNMGGSDNLARQADREAFQIESEIRRVEEDMRRLFDNLRQKIKQADKLLASVQTYCAENSAVGGKALCSDIASKERELASLSDSLQAAFDALAAKKKRTAIETPPGRKLMKKIFD